MLRLADQEAHSSLHCSLDGRGRAGYPATHASGTAGRHARPNETESIHCHSGRPDVVISPSPPPRLNPSRVSAVREQSATPCCRRLAQQLQRAAPHVRLYASRKGPQQESRADKATTTERRRTATRVKGEKRTKRNKENWAQETVRLRPCKSEPRAEAQPWPLQPIPGLDRFRDLPRNNPIEGEPSRSDCIQ